MPCCAFEFPYWRDTFTSPSLRRVWGRQGDKAVMDSSENERDTAIEPQACMCRVLPFARRLQTLPPPTHISEQSGLVTEMSMALRYGATGLLAMAVHAIIAFTLILAADVAPLFAHTLGFLGGFVVAAYGHARFTFRMEADRVGARRRFFAVCCAALVVSQAALFVLLESGLNELVSQAVAILVSTGISYIASRLWAFTPQALQDQSQKDRAAHLRVI